MSKRAIHKFIRKFGFDVIRANPGLLIPADLEPDYVALIQSVMPYTMTSVERVYAVIQAVEHIMRAGVAGDIVECGVWRGGSMMAAARALMQHGDVERQLYLFDTYDGMPEPDDVDVALGNKPARVLFEANRTGVDSSKWCYASLEDVRGNLLGTGYPADKIHFIQGKVENTIPSSAPRQIALLRLDTDWYESTLHELIHLYPRLCPGGILILDDYGHWAGARKAIDEYFAESAEPIFLSRIDYTGRIGVKP